MSADPTYEELKAAYIELLEANHRLSQMLINNSDRLEESRRELMAEAWDEGFRECAEWWEIHHWQHSGAYKDNRYRRPLPFKDAQ